jgi:hypothetical protein
MTARAMFQVIRRHQVCPPDFSRLDCVRARERVRELVAIGLAESTVGDLVGWDVASVRRACAERGAPVESWSANHARE